MVLGFILAKKLKKVRFGIIGYGHIGKRHAEEILKHSQAELVSICDIDEQKNNLEIAFYSAFQSMLEKENIDVVCICTPNGLHAEHGLMAIQHQKHIVCEKPMALTSADCERMISAAKHNNVEIFCVMQNRFSPPSVWIKEVIESGVLGKIHLVQMNCFWNRDERYYSKGSWHGTRSLDGGTLFTQFSHYVDTLFWLFGKFENIQSRLYNLNHSTLIDFEDSGFVTFNTASVPACSLNYSTSVSSKNFETSLTIIAENGTVEIAGQYMNEVRHCDIKNYEMPILNPAPKPNDYGGKYQGSASNHSAIIHNVIQTLNGLEKPAVSAKEGKSVVEIIENIYQKGIFYAT